MKTIFLAGGCFWGVEKYFSLVKGIVNTEVGYANGTMHNPRYEHLKQGLDDAAETVKIEYDEEVISLEKILELYLRIINPYSISKQGGDVGVQYRTGIYYLNKDEKDRIINYLDKKIEGLYRIEVKLLDKYFKAEDYHQNYLDKNPGGYCHIDMSKLKKDELK
ncbi:MAG TPA: peptide-methionine (S)-S-oxide reductase MsrA [Erysipelotrichaceae bacterium]|nr:peptide-methionine (S)-S-oxide reductase MsrA [Erysipelotrichaceae bacterium]